MTVIGRHEKFIETEDLQHRLRHKIQGGVKSSVTRNPNVHPLLSMQQNFNQQIFNWFWFRFWFSSFIPIIIMMCRFSPLRNSMLLQLWIFFSMHDWRSFSKSPPFYEAHNPFNGTKLQGKPFPHIETAWNVQWDLWSNYIGDKTIEFCLYSAYRSRFKECLAKGLSMNQSPNSYQVDFG